MAFNDKLPAMYKSLIVQRNSAKSDLMELEEIADPDFVDYHECDCEYCPIPEAPEYTDKERAEADEKAEELRPVVADYEQTIRRVKGYAKVNNIELPEAKLL